MSEPAAASMSGATTVGWIVLAVVALSVAAFSWMRYQRRRTTARYAALLAGSELVVAAPAAGRAAGTRLDWPQEPAPGAAAGERSSPRAAVSGINSPPASERRWLSQRPPSSVKDPPI